MQTQYGKYELQRPLGSGAAGVVYRALDTFSGIEVALKVFERDFLQGTARVERARDQFMNEAALVGRLAHPHIVAIHEAVMQEDTGYVAMEYVDGGNLLRFTRPDGRLPVSDAVQIGFKSCSALDYAFRQGIIHRDIKPANVLVADGTNIKLADFGAALLQASEQPGQLVVGTPGYMSPEQMMGKPLTYHSDMYAMGVMLYELLTGRRPFEASSRKEMFYRILSESAEPPSSLRREVPARLDEIVLRVIDRDPQARYPTWAELALDLAQVGRLSVYERDIADSEKFGTLRKSELFGSLDDAYLWEIVHWSRWRRLPPRSPVLTENEAGSSMFLVGSGELKVTKRGRLLNVLKAGECFGEMAFIQGTAIRQATVEAMTDVLIAEFDVAALNGLSEGCRLQISQGMLRTLAVRLALANDRIAQPV